MQASKQQSRDNTRRAFLHCGGLVSGNRVNNSGFEEALFGVYRVMPLTYKTISQCISRQELLVEELVRRRERRFFLELLSGVFTFSLEFFKGSFYWLLAYCLRVA